MRMFKSWVRVICEDDVCPALEGHSGWYKQQILKLGAAKIVSSQYYLVLDADIILKPPTGLRDLFPSGKPIFEKVPAGVHWKWLVASQEILKSKVELNQESIIMGVTPEFLHRETCLALQQAVACRNNVAEWDRFLFNSRHTGWTEYTLYWLYILEQGLDQQLYDWSAKHMHQGIWLREHSGMLLQRHLRRIFAPDSDSFFLVVQSNMDLDLSFVQKRILPHLALSDTHLDAHKSNLSRRLRLHLLDYPVLVNVMLARITLVLTKYGKVPLKRVLRTIANWRQNKAL
jgi:Family of unknown function (DUF6492)